MSNRTVTVLVTLTVFILLGLALDIKQDKDLQQKSIVMDFFNDQPVKLEAWMFGQSVDQFAEEWCVSHSIPDDQRESLVQELVGQWNTAIHDIMISRESAPVNKPAEP